MIARKHRFRGHNSVSQVRGGRIHSQLFSVYFSDKSRHSTYRMAVVVSKKISKSAVVRNRIRRRFYEAVRTNRILDSSKLDIVFVAKSIELATLEHKLFQVEIDKACRKAIASHSSKIHP